MPPLIDNIGDAMDYTLVIASCLCGAILAIAGLILMLSYCACPERPSEPSKELTAAEIIDLIAADTQGE